MAKKSPFKKEEPKKAEKEKPKRDAKTRRMKLYDHAASERHRNG